MVEMKHRYEYARPALTTDSVIFYRDDDELLVLLIKRNNEPCKGYWALPGGYVEEGESLIQGAYRELKEETGITNVELKQVAAFGDPGRDPRGWQVTVAFYGFVEDKTAVAGDDAGDVRWFAVDKLPQLAVDHGEIIKTTYRKLGKPHE